MNIGGNEGILFARIDDLCRFADSGRIGSSCFLSPCELHFARNHLKSMGMSGRFFEWGGYEDAERKKIFVLPEYAEGVSRYSELFEFGFEEDVRAVLVKGSGYRENSHRDFLGAVLGLGLRRDVVGDIIMLDGDMPETVIICEKNVSNFIKESLTKVGSDTVRTFDYVLSGDFSYTRKFVEISDTVASARADCIVSSLCKLSREKAREAVVSGLLEIDYECEERPDRIINAPSIISVKGYGKFRINSVSEQTKKGRYRLRADKYI